MQKQIILQVGSKHIYYPVDTRANSWQSVPNSPGMVATIPYDLIILSWIGLVIFKCSVGTQESVIRLNKSLISVNITK